MPSFTSLFSYAALGFAAFASVQAAPLLSVDAAVGAVVKTPIVGAAVGAVADIDVRADCKPLPAIIVDLTVDLSAILAPLAFGTSANVTVEVVGSIIEEAKSVVAAAIVDVKLLVGLNLDVVLSTATGVISVVDLAGLLCALITLIFSVISVVLSVVVSVDLEIIAPLLCDLLVLVAELLQLVLSLVAGLLAVLLPLIFNIIVPVILNLNLVSVFAFLGVSIGEASTGLY